MSSDTDVELEKLEITEAREYNDIYDMHVHGSVEGASVRGERNIITSEGITVHGNSNTIKGNKCTVHGNHNTIEGSECTVEGMHNHVNGHMCKLKGNMNKINANHCEVKGDENDIDGSHCCIEGTDNTINGNYATINGRDNMVFGTHSRRIGRNNIRMARTVTRNRRIDRNQNLRVHVMTGAVLNEVLRQVFSAAVSDGEPDDEPQPVQREGQTEKFPVLEGDDEDEPDENRTCRICLEKKPSVLLMPCHHMCMCRSCSRRVGSTHEFQCPMCRKHVEGWQLVYSV